MKTTIGRLICLLVVSVPHTCALAGDSASVCIIAHRGNTGRPIPENTLSAFRECLRTGVDVIETDLRGSNDREILIIHDETVDRTTDGSGVVSAMDFEAIRKLHTENNEKIPTYREVLELVKDDKVRLLLDVKSSKTLSLEMIISLSDKYGMIDRIIMGIRNIEDLRTVRKSNPAILTLGFISSPELIDEFIADGVNIIRLWPRWIEEDPGLVEKTKLAGVPVWSTCTDSSRSAHQFLVNAGVKGIITDYPGILMESLSGIKDE